MSFSVLNNAQNRKYSYFFLPPSASSSSYNPPMRQLFLLVPLLLLLGCSGKTEVVTHYQNGMIQSKGYLDADGKKTGDWREWDINGNIKLEAKWEGGKLLDANGIVTYWHSNGQKHREGAVENGLREGEWTEWFEDGRIRITNRHRKGRKHGLETQWYIPPGSKGIHKEVVPYQDGIINGRVYAYFENGFTHSWSDWVNNEMDGDSQEYALIDGVYFLREEGAYVESNKDGRWTTWWSKGNKWKEETYKIFRAPNSRVKVGKLHGIYTIWYITSGGGQKSEEGEYVFLPPEKSYRYRSTTSKKHGVWHAWRPNGERKPAITYEYGNVIE